MRTTRTLSFISTVARNAPKYRRPRPGTAERPPYRAGDPLVENPKAKVTALENTSERGQTELTFIHRPPPSAPTPFSMTTAPSSPLLILKSDVAATPRALPPLLHPPKVTAEKDSSNADNEHPRMSDADMEKLKQLRRSDPFKYSRSQLAEMFKCTPAFVGMVAPLKKTQCKAAHRALNEKHERNREHWSEKHSVVMAIRKKRKELW